MSKLSTKFQTEVRTIPRRNSPAENEGLRPRTADEVRKLAARRRRGKRSHADQDDYAKDDE